MWATSLKRPSVVSFTISFRPLLLISLRVFSDLRHFPPVIRPQVVRHNIATTPPRRELLERIEMKASSPGKNVRTLSSLVIANAQPQLTCPPIKLPIYVWQIYAKPRPESGLGFKGKVSKQDLLSDKDRN